MPQSYEALPTPRSGVGLNELLASETTAMPERIQLKRTKGWRMPPNTVKVDRTTKWGNPFRVGMPNVPDAAAAIALFKSAMEREELPGDSFELGVLKTELRGKNLACWCRIGEPCHADVLLSLANA
jgi:hypothetical protein